MGSQGPSARRAALTLLGATRNSIPIYGSGGFTSYTVERLQEQLGEWVGSGIRAVQMKIGRDMNADQKRVHAACKTIGPTAQLFVDANGAYDRKIALRQADRFAGDDVSWFEAGLVG